MYKVSGHELVREFVTVKDSQWNTNWLCSNCLLRFSIIYVDDSQSLFYKRIPPPDQISPTCDEQLSMNKAIEDILEVHDI